jgi:cytochrome c-type biogenesis protein CcsB
MKKIFLPFFSMTATGVMLVAFAVVIGFATFVENDYGTPSAKLLVYNAWWFEALLFLLAINLTGSVLINRLYTRAKWPIGFFHLAFVIILAGAAVTRHFSFEGTLHIREESSNNRLISRNTYIQVKAARNEDLVQKTKAVRFVQGINNRFKTVLHPDGERVVVKLKNILYNASERPVESAEGEPVITLMAVDADNQRSDFYLKHGDKQQVGNLTFRFGAEEGDTSSLTFSIVNDTLRVAYHDTLKMIQMSEEVTEALAPMTAHAVNERMIYQAGAVGFVVIQYYPRAKMELKAEGGQKVGHGLEALVFEVTSGQQTEELIVFGHSGMPGDPGSVNINGTLVQISYGALIHHLPFTLYLKDFQLERYPGSNSPSSFASEVVLIDRENGVEKPYRIFMNNILKYGGYRFFQSHYDPDEKGTILSVNYDAPGTRVTYIGYFIMTLGMVLTFFFRKSRFRRLVTSLIELLKSRPGAAMILIPLWLLSLTATAHPGMKQESGALAIADKTHAKQFGRLQVQNFDGRIEPVNTLASEILRKVSKKSEYQGMTPLQVMLSIMLNPERWQSEPIIRVSNAEIARIIKTTGKYASFNDFLDQTQPNGYALSNYVQAAYNRPAGQRTKFDKEIINVDERLNILYKLLQGGFMSIFPVPRAPDNKWVSLPEAASLANHQVAAYAMTATQNYLTALQKGVETGDYTAANQALAEITQYQQAEGTAVYPHRLKTSLEIFYINFTLYAKLSRAYMLVGFVLLILHLISLLSARPRFRWARPAGFWIVLVLFVFHTAGLGIRWYISGHAPWSNGYETLLYISWSVTLAGLIFSRWFPIVLSVASMLSAISLFVAGMSWMSPELTNLVPVLKSYWLIIHVAVITASYGFLGIGAKLGLLNLILMILKTPSNALRINFTIRGLSRITEMALIIGLYLLTIGSFLGGVWANESWGRYWGWDPKETWALVTILVYAFITHMHRIPGLRGEFAFSTAALLGFGSVLMTFFGVNYYLSGLHSYAQGDPPPVPAGVYIALVVVALVVITAWVAQRKGNHPEEPDDRRSLETDHDTQPE